MPCFILLWSLGSRPPASHHPPLYFFFLPRVVDTTIRGLVDCCGLDSPDLDILDIQWGLPPGSVVLRDYGLGGIRKREDSKHLLTSRETKESPQENLHKRKSTKRHLYNYIANKKPGRASGKANAEKLNHINVLMFRLICFFFSPHRSTLFHDIRTHTTLAAGA